MVKEQPATPSMLYPNSLQPGATEKVTTATEGDETKARKGAKRQTLEKADRQTAGDLADGQTDGAKGKTAQVISGTQRAGNVESKSTQADGAKGQSESKGTSAENVSIDTKQPT